MAPDARGSQEKRKFIFLEYYIIEEGLMWNSIFGDFGRKGSSRSRVKLLYDDIGCMATLPEITPSSFVAED